jgi:RND family efflux transporter MFP subunit
LENKSAGIQPGTTSAAQIIAGTGLVESALRDVKLGSELSGIVNKVFVQVGQKIKHHEPLIALTNRHLNAELESRKAAVLVAQTELDNAQSMYAFMKPLIGRRSVSQESITVRSNEVQIAQARLKKAQVDVELVKTELSRSIIESPIDGQVLQVNIREGERISTDQATSPIVVGRTNRLWVRVEFDENDAQRFDKNYSAIAYVKGDSKKKIPLTFELIEPLVVPKKTLTGDSTERVDTRVLQVLYSFDPEKNRVFVGQQLDVLVDVPDGKV